MQHLLAVQQVRAGLAQVAQINLRHKTEVVSGVLQAIRERAPPAGTCLNVAEQLGQVELPLSAEAGELQQEADGVVGLVQAGQTLHSADGV